MNSGRSAYRGSLRTLPRCFGAVAAAVVWVLVLSSGASPDFFRFIIRADPPAIPANGRSTATITIEINSAQNQSALNGSAANFVTTLGVIEPLTHIAGNTARVTLRSGTQPGVAIVTAIVGQSREQTQVKFLPIDGSKLLETRAISFTGRNLVFHPDAGLIVASGKTRVSFRRMRLRCGMNLQYDIEKEHLLLDGRPGENEVVFSNGRKRFVGDRLKFLMKPLQGMMLKINPEPERLYLAGDALAVIPADGDDLEAADHRAQLDAMKFPDPPSIGRGTVVLARQIVIYPGEKIKFKRAKIYINGKHVISLPLHVLPLRNNAYDAYGIVGDRVFGFNTSGGIGLDFPFYYRVSSGGQGAIRLRHSGGDGFFTEAPGWSLAVEEEYSLGDDGEGTFVLDKLGQGNWGASLNHSHAFSDSASGYFYVSSPEHADAFGRATLTRDYDRFSVGLETYGNVPEDRYASGTAQAYVQTRAKPLGKTNMDYSASFEVSYSNNPEAADPEVVSQTIQTPLRLPTWKLAASTSVTSSLQPQVYHSSAGVTNAGIGASVTLSQTFTPTTFGSLTYTRSPGISSSSGVLNTQYISGSLFSVPNRHWQLTSTGTYNLTDSSVYGSITADYRLNTDWRLGLTSSYQKFVGDSFTDHDIVIGKRIGRLKMEGIVGWSKSRNDIYFQVGNISF
ncbi:MAG: hypothetical protein GW893_07640 [Armatimonadetes bacterium]|nr:hypothetical protein [Armatimonadota bacterium]